MITKLYSVDPERLGKEGPGVGGQGSPLKGDIEQILKVYLLADGDSSVVH